MAANNQNDMFFHLFTIYRTLKVCSIQYIMSISLSVYYFRALLPRSINRRISREKKSCINKAFRSRTGVNHSALAPVRYPFKCEPELRMHESPDHMPTT